MKTLFTAIYTLFTATSGGPPAVHNAFYTNIGGRLYFTEAPQAATFPYAVFWMVSSAPDYYFNGEVLEDFAIQIDLFDRSSSSSDIGGYVVNLKALFDDCSVTVTGYGNLIFEREFSHVLRDPAENIWQWATQYNVLLEKS